MPARLPPCDPAAAARGYYEQGIAPNTAAIKKSFNTAERNLVCVFSSHQRPFVADFFQAVSCLFPVLRKPPPFGLLLKPEGLFRVLRNSH